MLKERFKYMLSAYIICSEHIDEYAERAELVFRKKRFIRGKGTFIEMIVWKVPKSEHFPDAVKYSFALIHNGKRILGYDNERGKSHHRHFMKKEEKVIFESVEELRDAFLNEVKEFEKRLKRGDADEVERG